MKVGLIVGKFRPFHIGHASLIKYAMGRCDHLIVLIVYNKENDMISPKQRYDWIKGAFPTVDVRIANDINDDDNSERWAEYTTNNHHIHPDIVFSSEDYGNSYAYHMGCEHDRYVVRSDDGPAGRLIMSDPFKYWHWMYPKIREYFVVKFTIVGAESTGKTTLAQRLAKEFHTVWTPEYGRFYAEGMIHADGYGTWSTNDFEIIANEQNLIEDRLISRANKIMICDTDAFASGLWHERYMGFRSEAVENLLRYDLWGNFYFVCDPSVNFVQDGTRDGEKIRQWHHDLFLKRLMEDNMPFVVLSGTYEERFERACKIIRENYSNV